MLVEGVAVKGVYRQKMGLGCQGEVRNSLFWGGLAEMGGRGDLRSEFSSFRWVGCVGWLLLCPTSMN